MATAAALGHAARRLGGTGSGALRQTQEAAASRLSSAVEGRLMPRRLAHTEVQNPCPCGKFVNAAELKRIQKMTEELYEAVSGAHNKYWWKDQDRRMNTALLRQLSDHVCRRSSGDPTWYVYERNDRVFLLFFCP
jgi:hypothetical protein